MIQTGGHLGYHDYCMCCMCSGNHHILGRQQLSSLHISDTLEDQDLERFVCRLQRLQWQAETNKSSLHRQRSLELKWLTSERTVYPDTTLFREHDPNLIIDPGLPNL